MQGLRPVGWLCWSWLSSIAWNEYTLICHLSSRAVSDCCVWKKTAKSRCHITWRVNHSWGQEWRFHHRLVRMRFSVSTWGKGISSKEFREIIVSQLPPPWLWKSDRSFRKVTETFKRSPWRGKSVRSDGVSIPPPTIQFFWRTLALSLGKKPRVFPKLLSCSFNGFIWAERERGRQRSLQRITGCQDI